MIFITRAACPSTLSSAPKKGDLYNRSMVVHALWEMQYGKCCYCERKLPEKGHLKAVEHFAPKAIFKGLRNEWTNLLLACAQCNGRKSDKFPTVLSLIPNEDKVLYIRTKKGGTSAMLDPSSIDPENHIDFDFTGEEWAERFGVVMAKKNSVLGRETIATVGLHEPFYAALRWNHFSKVVNVHYLNLLQALRDKNPLEIAAQRDRFRSLMTPQTEFAGFVRAFARFKKLDRTEVGLTIP